MGAGPRNRQWIEHSTDTGPIVKQWMTCPTMDDDGLSILALDGPWVQAPEAKEVEATDSSACSTPVLEQTPHMSLGQRPNYVWPVQVSCCFTSTEVMLKDYQGRGAQDGHLDFHTAPGFCVNMHGSVIT